MTNKKEIEVEANIIEIEINLLMDNGMTSKLNLSRDNQKILFSAIYNMFNGNLPYGELIQK